MNSSGTLKIARNGYIVIAVVFCALGIFLMAVPEKAVKIICVLAGISVHCRWNHKNYRLFFQRFLLSGFSI